MDKILEIYKEWQDSSTLLRDLEVIPDERTPQEKKKAEAEEIARRIREVITPRELWNLLRPQSKTVWSPAHLLFQLCYFPGHLFYGYNSVQHDI
ncbi:hypothetical protein R1flu_014379 [Riccia fluitans]|uniref:Uncharacterized protein n=1 Tax=Riccia fluitans TaxID=41844 RepID=A0ABD1YGA5_9MARC